MNLLFELLLYALVGFGYFCVLASFAVLAYVVYQLMIAPAFKRLTRNKNLRLGSRAAMIGVLCGCLIVAPVFVGCSAAWTTTLDNILVAAAPALINILNIISLAKGMPVNTAFEAKITTDATTIKTLAGDFAKASAAAAPTACSQLQAAISTYSSDESQVMSLASISDQATQAKVEELSALVSGSVTGILAAIPNCQQAALARATLEKSTVPLPLKTFVDSYNTVLVVKTGNPAVDAYTAKHKVHVHNKFVRVIAFGTSF